MLSLVYLWTNREATLFVLLEGLSEAEPGCGVSFPCVYRRTSEDTGIVERWRFPLKRESALKVGWVEDSSWGLRC